MRFTFLFASLVFCLATLGCGEPEEVSPEEAAKNVEKAPEGQISKINLDGVEP